MSFIELQIKVVQKQAAAKRSNILNKNKVLGDLSYAGSDFEPKVLFCNLSQFQSKQEDSIQNTNIKKIVSRMFFTREETDGKQLHHSALVVMDNGDVYFYNEFSLIHKFEGKFADAFADFDMLYLVENWNQGANRYRKIND